MGGEATAGTQLLLVAGLLLSTGTTEAAGPIYPTRSSGGAVHAAHRPNDATQTLPRFLARRGGIKIRAEPVIEETSRGRAGSRGGDGDKKGKGGKDEEEDVVGARLSYGSDGQKGLRMDVDLDVNELTNHLGPAAKPLVAVAKAIQQTIFYTAPMLALAGLITQIAGITCSRYTKTQADKKGGSSSSSRVDKGKSRAEAAKQQQQQQDAKAKAVAAATKDKAAAAKSSSSSSFSLRDYLWWPFSSSSSSLSSSKAAFVGNVRGGASLPKGVALDWNAFGVLVARALGQWASLIAAGAVIGRLVNEAAVQGGKKAAKGLLAKLGGNPRVLLGLDVFTCFSAIFLSEKVGFLKATMDMGWYHRVLKKPTWTPKPIVFPLVWVPLKLLQTVAFTIVWRLVSRDAVAVPVLFFLLHLCLGDLWNRVFFGEKRIGFGLSVIYSFYVSLAAACYSFYNVKHVAGYLLVPTAVWVFIATSLNYSIWLLNQQECRFPIKKT